MELSPDELSWRQQYDFTFMTLVVRAIGFKSQLNRPTSKSNAIYQLSQTGGSFWRLLQM